jgi:hypothetical protein
MTPQIIPAMEMMSRTAPINIKILAQFLPVKSETAKNNGSIDNGNISIESGPSKKLSPTPIIKTTMEPIIWRIPSIVTPNGLEILRGAVEAKVISPQCWQYATPESFALPHF